MLLRCLKHRVKLNILHPLYIFALQHKSDSPSTIVLCWSCYNEARCGVGCRRNSPVEFVSGLMRVSGNQTLTWDIHPSQLFFFIKLTLLKRPKTMGMALSLFQVFRHECWGWVNRGYVPLSRCHRLGWLCRPARARRSFGGRSARRHRSK